MKKLFRFKYEPCNGTCYHWCDVLPGELNKLTEKQRRLTVEMMVNAHQKLCDNPDYSFGVDQDEKSKTFVAHFRTPEKTDTYLSSDFQECVSLICSAVLATDIPAISGACNFGDNGAENLGVEILRACSDEAYREEHHAECPCSKAA